MAVVKSFQNCVIRYRENKVLSVCSILGPTIKDSTTTRGTAGEGGSSSLSEFIHQILMDLIEVLRLYKASWKQLAFMLKISARILMVQEDMALCVNCMLCRLTEGSCMLLRWEAKQELVPMTFFLLEKESMSTQSYQLFIWGRNEWGQFEIMILPWYFYSSRWIFCPILSANRNSI